MEGKMEFLLTLFLMQSTDLKIKNDSEYFLVFNRSISECCPIWRRRISDKPLSLPILSTEPGTPPNFVANSVLSFVISYKL